MSLISQAIVDATEGHSVDDRIDQCAIEPNPNNKKPCRLKTRLEYAYVGLVTYELLREIRRRTQQEQKYQDWFYIPNLRAESKVGCDLSFGRINHLHRVRSMHKVISSWCDLQRSWKIPARGPDRNHLAALISEHQNLRDIQPYLILHVCYCLHDFRRMGQSCNDFVIPGPTSLIRTVVIKLESLVRYSENEIRERLFFQYSRRSNKRLRNETNQEFLDRISDPANHQCAAGIDGQFQQLPLLTFDEFIQEAVNHLLEEN
jgi:hypothetical protein